MKRVQLTTLLVGLVGILIIVLAIQELVHFRPVVPLANGALHIRLSYMVERIYSDLTREIERSNHVVPPSLPLPPLPEPDPQAPLGAWNAAVHGPRNEIEQNFQDSGAWLVMRSGPGLPGWWYGNGNPKGTCIRGSLYTNQGDAGPWLYVCSGDGKWVAR